MIVIDKKRVSIIAICLLLGMFAYFYEGAKINLEQQVQETTSTPISGKVVVLDAGHGTPDEGGRLLKSEKVAYIRYFKK